MRLGFLSLGFVHSVSASENRVLRVLYPPSKGSGRAGLVLPCPLSPFQPLQAPCHEWWGTFPFDASGFCNVRISAMGVELLQSFYRRQKRGQAGLKAAT